MTTTIYDYMVNELHLTMYIGLKIFIGLLANIMYSNSELLQMLRHGWEKHTIVLVLYMGDWVDRSM